MMGYYGWGYPMSPVKIDAKDTRIAELTAALKPFADKAGTNTQLDNSWHIPVEIAHLRAARAAYLGEKE